MFIVNFLLNYLMNISSIINLLRKRHLFTHFHNFDFSYKSRKDGYRLKNRMEHENLVKRTIDWPQRNCSNKYSDFFFRFQKLQIKSNLAKYLNPHNIL